MFTRIKKILMICIVIFSLIWQGASRNCAQASALASSKDAYHFGQLIASLNVIMPIKARQSNDLAISDLSTPTALTINTRSMQAIPSATIKNGDFALHGSNSYNNNQDAVNLSWDELVGNVGGYQVERNSNNIDDTASWHEIASNYGKHVKVLNVYPNGGDFLKTWMSQDNGNGQPISMNLIEVVPIALSDFDNNPNAYLKDNNGKYQYDCIYFGSKDSNGGLSSVGDLSSAAYNATLNFGQTGRSVIFGHDTLTDQGHPYFDLFANKLGLIMNNNIPANMHRDGARVVGAQKVQIATNGFLNHYPYYLDPAGTYIIRPSHTAGQFYQYGSGAIRWMEFKPPLSALGAGSVSVNTNYLYDSSNNKIGDNNWYLITKDNYAMTQTGHSTGSSSPDETKILANMIYYTSTLNTGTSGEDRTVRDSVAPDTPQVSADYNDLDPDNKIDLNINSQDNASNYYYRVKTKQSNTIHYSDIIQQPVLSNIKGYIYQINTSAINKVDVATDSTGQVTNINLPVKADQKTNALLSNVDRWSNQYIHLVAVDRDNNVSTPFTVAIKDLEPRKDSQIQGKVWQDDNYNGKLETTEKGLNSLTVNLFRKTAAGSLIFVKSATTDNKGDYLFSDLRTGVYQLGINSNTIKGLVPTSSGQDSGLLEQGLYVAADKTSYALGETIHLTSTNKLATQNLGLIKQTAFLNLQTVPQLNFGLHFLPFFSNLDLDNQTSNQLTVVDQRYNLVQIHPGVNDYFVPYKINVNLSKFMNENDHDYGLQQAKIGFKADSSDADIDVLPNSQDTTLQQKNLPVVASNTTNYQRIHLMIPKNSQDNVINVGRYQATLTYTAVNSL